MLIRILMRPFFRRVLRRYKSMGLPTYKLAIGWLPEREWAEYRD